MSSSKNVGRSLVFPSVLVALTLSISRASSVIVPDGNKFIGQAIEAG
jgi:hypothetical protein